MFQNRKLIIATMHQKERVIAPVVEQALGVQCFVDKTLNTDLLGTFTGEIERTQDPIATARQKCLEAMKHTSCDLGIASEGSFGLHPSMFFVNADDELLIFIDSANDIEVVVRTLSTSTNFAGKQVNNWRDLQAFAQQAGFPSHGLILRKSKNDVSELHKGITDEVTLQRIFEQLNAAGQGAYVETDMRAMFNPTRMAVIAETAKKLADKINTKCPSCHMPGFGVTDVNKGLPCSLCGTPTNSTLSFVYVCKRCGYTREEMYPHNKTAEDPMYCDHCNP